MVAGIKRFIVNVMSLVNSLLSSIRKETGQRFRLSDLNILKSAIKAAQVASVAAPLKMTTGQGGVMLSIIKSDFRDMMDLPFEVKIGVGKDGQTPSVHVWRNGATFTSHAGNLLKIEGEDENGHAEKAYSFGANEAGCVAVCLSWTYKISESKESAPKMSLEVIEVKEDEDCKELVNPITAKGGQGKSRVILAVIRSKSNGSLIFEQLVQTSLAAVWSYDIDDKTGKAKVGLTATAVPGAVVLKSQETA